MAQNSTIKVIDKVIEQARVRYDDLMQSEYISVGLRVDNQETRGQVQDSEYVRSTKQENTKQMTCMLGIKVKRGSYVEMMDNTDDTEYSIKGIVISDPIETPVDYLFSTLLYNTTVELRRSQITYNDDGDIINNSPYIIKDIGCFVQRIGMRERQIDAGIDRNSVNQIITTRDWDIQKEDILYIGSDRYKITDIEELDNDLLSGYMTYYRD
jgi:hypothetical protein